jgi:trehalose 6-phosphate phosphatase
MTADPSVAEHAARLAGRADEVALCLDFDGTLSPIVDDPQAARPLPGTVELLGQLAARFAAVALISGRPAAYLAEHAAAPGVRYLGLHGLQEIRDGQVWVDPRLEAARSAVVAPMRTSRPILPPRPAAPTWRTRSRRSPSTPGGSPTPTAGPR